MHKDVASFADNSRHIFDENQSSSANYVSKGSQSHLEDVETKRTGKDCAFVDGKSATKDSGIQNQQITDSHTGVTSSQEDSTADGSGDTLVFPLVQMGSIGVRLDQEVTGHLLRTAEAGSHCVLASGYFNLTKEYMDLVLGSKAKYDILMASPKVMVTSKAVTQITVQVVINVT